MKYNTNEQDNVQELKPVLSWAYKFLINRIYTSTYIFCTLLIITLILSGGIYIGMRHSDYVHAQKNFEEYKNRTDDKIAVQQVSINNLKINLKALELKE